MSDNGKQIKENFENSTRSYLTPKGYFFLRLDGKAFSSYTRDLQKPFDLEFMADMNDTAKFLCENIQGTKCAFVQSDEISIVLTDFETPQTSLWFDGNIQKIVSTSAALASAKFNQLRLARGLNKLAVFDSRVFPVPDFYWANEVFIWRQEDCSKNSIQMLARTHFSHKHCENKSSRDLLEMLKVEKNISWHDCPVGFQRGRVIHKQSRTIPSGSKVLESGKTININEHTRQDWVIVEPPVFSQEPNFLKQFIPIYQKG